MKNDFIEKERRNNHIKMSYNMIKKKKKLTISSLVAIDQWSCNNEPNGGYGIQQE